MRRILGSRHLRSAFAVLAIGLVCYAIVDQWDSVAPSLSRLSAAGLLGASMAVLVGMFSMLKSWQASVAGLGSPLRLATAGGIFFIGQLGKYVPGSLWPVVVQMELGKDAGVPRQTSALGLLYIYLMFVVTAGVVGAPGLPTVSALVNPWMSALLVLVGLGALVPPVLNRLLSLAARLFRALEAPRMDGRAIVISSAWAVGMWLAFAAQVVILSKDMGHEVTAEGVLTCVSAFTIAWICGFLAIFAPAGGGVRELVLTALMAGTIGGHDAFAIALASRLLMTAADLVCAGIGFALIWRRRPLQ